MTRRNHLAPCAEPGCPALVPGGGRCPLHAIRAWVNSDRHDRLPGDWTRRRRRILERDHHRCYLCGAPANEVDHIEAGDDHHNSNLAAICTPCHRAKTARESHAARRARRPGVTP